MPTTFHQIPRERPVTPLLDRADTPAGLRRLAESELEALANELRQYLLYSVGQTGGHFGAGLGVIELTIALHYIFDTPDDRLVWDVGHQAYPHKILTGRRERMGTLRQKDGLAAFPRRSESEYDTFGVGHSSTSIGAALGMAIAARLQGSPRKSVAVIGDGALTAGMAFEALNHASDVKANMLVVLNDNDMSISKNVGGLSNYLAKIISSRTYSSMREGSKKILSHLPGAWEIARKVEEHAKGMLVPGTLFEELVAEIKECKSLRYPAKWGDNDKFMASPASYYQSLANRLRMYARQMMGIRKRLHRRLPNDIGVVFPVVA